MRVCASVGALWGVIFLSTASAQQPGVPATSGSRSGAPANPPVVPASPVPSAQSNSSGSGNNSNSLPMQFQSHGLDYEALTRNGITVMYASLPPHVKDFNIIQITVTNGSLISWTVKPEDFSFVRQDGTVLGSVSADDVVESLLEKAGRNDVIKLQLLYESSIYALSNFRSTNGYEQRREAAMAQFVNPRIKAAAAASAITLVSIKLRPGDSTDGAVFFENKTKDKLMGAGRLIAHACGETFTFQILPEPKLH